MGESFPKQHVNNVIVGSDGSTNQRADWGSNQKDMPGEPKLVIKVEAGLRRHALKDTLLR